MSRCFPFPPPGYEKKPTTDEPDLLKKEKRKEKKHKKDKKDKEKKEGKEKREKDKSEGKHKEKKEKKDKHRDKKKDKDKDKGKASTSDEKKVYSQFEVFNGENLNNNEKSGSSSDRKSSVQLQNGEYNEQTHKISSLDDKKSPIFHGNEQIRKNSSLDHKKSPILNSNEQIHKDSFLDDKKSPLFHGNEQIHKNSSLDDKKSPIFRGKNGEFHARNRIKAEDTENLKFVQELGRRIRDEEKGTGSHQFVVEGRKGNINKVEIQKTDWRQSSTASAAFGGHAAAQNKINGATPPPLEKKIDEKEKVQEKEGDDKRGGKRKNKDRDKDKQRQSGTEKEKKEEKSKEKSEKKKAEREKNKHMKKPDTVASLNNLSSRPPENSFQGVGIEENFKKRKDMETNGVFHENEPRPNKMARHISNISPENGRKLDFLQTPDKQTASQGAFNNYKPGSKDQRLNGIIPSPPLSIAAKKPPIPTINHIAGKPTPVKSPPLNTNHVATQLPPITTSKPLPSTSNHIAQTLPITVANSPPLIPNRISTQPPPITAAQLPNRISAQPPPITTTKPPPSTARLPPSSATAKQPTKKKPPPGTAEPSVKPPHPDTKYLNQILSVPKLDQWCGLDDQEWLFSGKTDPDQSCSKKTTMEELQVQVWSEAKHIESVDVCALPYVIPY